jgi:addiction module HigA family antidote
MIKNIRYLYNPTHPGRLINNDYIIPLNLTVGQVAEGLQVSRQTISKIINGKGNITPLIALKLSKAFSTSPEFWLNRQQIYDLAKAWKEADTKTIKQFYMLEAVD